MSQITCDNCYSVFTAKTIPAVKRILTMHKKKCIIEEIKEEIKEERNIVLKIENNIGTINIKSEKQFVIPRCKTCLMCKCQIKKPEKAEENKSEESLVQIMCDPEAPTHHEINL